MALEYLTCRQSLLHGALEYLTCRQLLSHVALAYLTCRHSRSHVALEYLVEYLTCRVRIRDCGAVVGGRWVLHDGSVRRRNKAFRSQRLQAAAACSHWPALGCLTCRVLLLRTALGYLTCRIWRRSLPNKSGEGVCRGEAGVALVGESEERVCRKNLEKESAEQIWRMSLQRRGGGGASRRI